MSAAVREAVSAEIQTRETDCCLCASDRKETVGTGVDFEYATCTNPFGYVRCTDCGHHYLNPQPQKSELSTIYPPHYGNYSNSESPGLAFRVKGWMEGRTLRRLGRSLPDHAAVMDIGCGDGRLLDGIKAYVPQVDTFEGVEISATAAASARKKGHTVRVAAVDDWTPEEARFDLVCLIQVLEHVFDPVGVVGKIHTMLKPGGLALIETPSTRCADFALFNKRYWGGYHFPRHLNLFDPPNLRRLLEAAGFEVVSVNHKLQPVHWVWTCHHYFMERGWPRSWYSTFHIKNPLWLGFFTLVDALQLILLRRSSNMQFVVRKR